jgi:hypothetical protein
MLDLFWKLFWEDRMVEMFSIENTERGVIHAREEVNPSASDELSIVEALMKKRVVANWVFGQARQAPDLVLQIVKSEAATNENFALLDGLWALCAKHGIVLNNEQKCTLFIDFHKIYRQ